MPKDPRSKARFSEKEVNAILRRAVEMQAAKSVGLRGDQPDGVSLSQLQQAAAELGLDPAVVGQAAAELSSSSRDSSIVSILGGPWRLDLERVIGRKVTAEEWPALLDEIRRASGRVGTPTNVGNAFEWSSTSPDTLHVSLLPSDNDTRVRVLSKHGDWGAVIYVPTLFAGMIASAAFAGALHLDAASGWALATGLVSASFLAARTVFSRYCSFRKKKTEDILERVSEAIASSEESAEQPAMPVTGYASPQVQNEEQPVSTSP